MIDKAKEILEKHSDHFICWKNGEEMQKAKDLIITAMLEFAILACELQKQECAREAETKIIPFTEDEEVDKLSILNAKNICDLTQ